MTEAKSLAFDQCYVRPARCRLRTTAAFALALLPTSNALQTLHDTARSETPFLAGKAGSSVYIGVHIPLRRTYRFSLDFHLNGTDEQQTAQLNRVLDKNHAQANDGPQRNEAEIPVHLRIVRMEGEATVGIIDKSFEEERRVGTDPAKYSMKITDIELVPGEYRIRIEALKDLDEVNGLPITFSVRPG
jgi:hypothetical protein